jgi:hypothetical protein
MADGAPGKTASESGLEFLWKTPTVAPTAKIIAKIQMAARRRASFFRATAERVRLRTAISGLVGLSLVMIVHHYNAVKYCQLKAPGERSGNLGK